MLTMKKLQEQINEIKKTYQKKKIIHTVHLCTNQEKEAINDLKKLGWKEKTPSAFEMGFAYTKLIKETENE